MYLCDRIYTKIIYKMRNFLISTFFLLPLTCQAQTVLTPEQKLEQAQKQLEEAQKALKEAQKAKEDAERNASEKSSNRNQGWTIPTTPQKKTINEKTSNDHIDDSKYLEGAITYSEKGDIVFKLKLDHINMSQDDIYTKILEYLTDLTSDSNQLQGSRVALVNQEKSTIVATVREYLIFSNTFISIDRTEFYYTIIAKCKDNQLDLSISRISYNYDQGRATGFKEPAENVISDKYALNKKHTKLSRIYGKFRRKTIDRKDEIFKNIKDLLIK